MRELKSEEARRGFRAILDEMERDPAAAVKIHRYDRPVAVVVSADWYDAVTALRPDGAWPPDLSHDVVTYALQYAHRHNRQWPNHANAYLNALKELGADPWPDDPDPWPDEPPW